MSIWTKAATFALLILFSTTAWAVKPVDYMNPPVFDNDSEFLDCSDFGMEYMMAAEWWVTEYGKMHFDKEGNLVRINGFVKLSDQLVWNTSEPEKYISSEMLAGGDEHNHFILEFDDEENVILSLEAGLNWKAVVPGSKPIAIHAGMLRWKYDEANDFWRIKTENGKVYTSKFFVPAVGILSAAVMPNIPGVDSFKGISYHTHKWPQNEVELNGKKVGIIGTGATAVQIIPEIAKVVDDLTIFQRTPNWCTPLHNKKIPHERILLSAAGSSIDERCLGGHTDPE